MKKPGLSAKEKQTKGGNAYQPSGTSAAIIGGKMKLSELSAKQRLLLKKLKLYENQDSVQVAGYGQAPWLSAAHALMRKGLADSYKTGSFYITDAGIKLLEGNR